MLMAFFFRHGFNRPVHDGFEVNNGAFRDARSGSSQGWGVEDLLNMCIPTAISGPRPTVHMGIDIALYNPRCGASSHYDLDANDGKDAARMDPYKYLDVIARLQKRRTKKVHSMDNNSPQDSAGQ